MIHEKIWLDQERTAFVEVYALDPEISYGVKKTWPAMVICPGGGYVISATKEGEAVAAQFLAQGYSCFVLRYSTFLRNREGLLDGSVEINEHAYYPTQVLQLMEVMHCIHEHKETWSIDTSNIFTIGFSAGGHICGTLALRFSDPKLVQQLSFVPNQNELKPKGCILCYPMLHGPSIDTNTLVQHGITDLQNKSMKDCLYGHQKPSEEDLRQVALIHYISDETPPMFLWHTTQDGVTDAKHTTDFVKELQNKHIPCEYHLFTFGEHGLACANEQYAKSQTDVDTTIAMWLPLVFHWLEQMKKAR